ncbi:hypothetical protein GCM10018955_63250 [Planomonospora venezuelensis]|nr:PAS domain S-box protein [Planomonospora venezuelensis]
MHDARRLQLLHATGLLEADEVPLLDRVTRMAVRWLQVPAAMVSLIDADRQVVVSSAGPAGPGRHEQSPLSQTLCRHIVTTDAPLTVPDAHADARWREIATAYDGWLAAYAGTPLRASRGQVLGTLCVVDAEPRRWSAEQLETMEDLAAVAEAEIAMRLTGNGSQGPAAFGHVPEAFVALDATGAVTGWNTAAARLFGRSADEAVGRPLGELISPERSRRDCELLLRRVRDERAREPGVQRLELTAVDGSGREFPAELAAQRHTGRGGPVWHAVLRDISDRHEERRQLEGERMFLQALMDSLDVRVAACDGDGRVVAVNQPLRETRPQISGLHVSELADAYGLLSPDGHTPLQPHQVPLARALAGEHVDGQQILMRAERGGPRRFAANGRPMDTPDGRRLGAVITLDDITDRNRAEALRAAQHAMTEVLADAASSQEAANDVVAAVTNALGWTYGEYWQVDEDRAVMTRIGCWSRPGRDLSAFAAGHPVMLARGQELPGMAWENGEPFWLADLDAVSPDFSRVKPALEAGLHAAVALPVRSGDQVLGVLVFAADCPQQRDDDLVELLDGVCAHMGRYMERRRAEELALALTQSRRQFDQIVNQLTDKIWTVEVRPDGTARPIYVNTEHTSVFGGRLHLSPDDDFIAVMLRFIHPDDHDGFRAYCATLISGERAQMEYRLIGLDGVTRWIWTRGLPRREGERLLVDGISTDITERRQITEEREHLLDQQRQQMDRLRQLDAMKDDLMAMASHELRSPIGVIRSYAEMLADAPGLPEDYRTFIEVIDRKSEHLQNLVDDLLDLARLDAGRVSVDARTVWLTGLVRQAVDEHRASATARRITLSVELPHRLHVHADPVRLRQVLDNLLSNAVKYTPDGGTVTVTAGHGTGAGTAPQSGREHDRAVTVTVADTGIGIPAEEYDQLFSRFFRASTARQAGIKGTGLGLAITRAIVEAHGGTIAAAPRQGGGTAFTVCLPIDPPDAA